VVDWVTLLAFLPAALALNLTPGADMMFCLGQGLRSGRVPALAASAGILTGSMVHVLIAGLGLGAVVASLPWAYDMIRWVGVSYLLFLAWRAFRGGDLDQSGAGGPASAVRSFKQGLMVNFFNPKVILFVLALLPQFIDPNGHILAQFLIYGAILGVSGFFINGAVGVFAGATSSAFAENPAVGLWMGRVSGSIFAALAVRLAFLEKGTS
jgi:threonine/homoserine/homoserine lactone efflux protein